MKKHSAWRLAGLLLVLVLVTSCFVGGTFAKYVTGGTGTDTARVAKFGVTVTANGSTFAADYATDDTSVASTISKSVVSSDNSKLVAPGTSGNMTSVTLAGTPEVAVNVKYEATFTLNDEWKDAGDNFYCPLEIKVGTTTYKGTAYTSADEFAAAVEAAIEVYSKNYTANNNLATTATAPAVSWSWAFEGDNVKDTYLGDQAAAGHAATVTLTVVTTVTQID